MATDPALATCRQIIRQKAKSFYFATVFLPRAKREATFVLYAFFRTIDDLVDEPAPGMDEHAVRRELDDWQQWLESDPRPPSTEAVRAALDRILTRYKIPPRYLIELIEGVRGDMAPRHLYSFPEYERYCYQVASTVGLTMSHVLGMRDERALPAAADLGIAMQMTNVLRDVGEDLGRGRVYLPIAEFAQFGYSLDDLRQRRCDDAFRALIRFHIARTRGYYARGVQGIRYLDEDSRFAITLAAHLYQRILNKIEAQQCDVFSRRAHTTMPEKLRIAAGLVVSRAGS